MAMAFQSLNEIADALIAAALLERQPHFIPSEARTSVLSSLTLHALRHPEDRLSTNDLNVNHLANVFDWLASHALADRSTPI
jgi:hypothetical protein